MDQFDERHPELKGFSAYYAAEIYPHLLEGETSRVAAQAKAKRLVFWSVVCGVFLFILLLALGVNLFLVLILSVLGISAIRKIRPSINNPIEMELKKFLIDGVCGYLGWSFSEVFNGRSALQKFGDMWLIPAGRPAYFEDHISGRARGYDFKLFETCLEIDNGENKTITFQGQLIELSLKKQVASTTVVLRNGFLFNPNRKGKLKRVGLVDPVFEKIFTAYGTDQVESRVLLTPDIIQACIELEKSFEGQNLRFGFTNDTLLIAIETGNRFEIETVAEPFTLSQRTRQIVEEIGAIFDLIGAIGKIDGV